MREASREIPQVSLLHILHIGAPVLVENGDTAMTVCHVCPFSGKVPMHLANTASCQAHIDARNGRGDGELRLRDLARPTTALNALMGGVERTPEHLHVARVSRRGALE